MKIKIKRVSNGFIVTNEESGNTEVFDHPDKLIDKFVIIELDKILSEITKGSEVAVDFNIIEDGKSQ